MGEGFDRGNLLNKFERAEKTNKSKRTLENCKDRKLLIYIMLRDKVEGAIASAEKLGPSEGARIIEGRLYSTAELRSNIEGPIC